MIFTPKYHSNNKNEGGLAHMMKEHRGPEHIPHHARKTLIHIDFGEDDMNLFKRIYEDEDEATAAIHVLMDAPPEIQILAAQLLSLIEEVAKYEH